MSRLIWFLLIVATLISGCSSGKKRLKVDVSGISVEQVVIHRYDLDLFNRVHPDLIDHLNSLQPRYSFFLGTDLNDSARLAQMDSYLSSQVNLDFLLAVRERLSSLKALEQNLTEVFRYIRYYFPDFRQPQVYSYISGGDYLRPVQYVDTVLLIGLDSYLGADYEPYTSDGVPRYRIQRMTPEFIIPDCMNAMAEVIYPPSEPGNTLLDYFIEAGKRLYLADAFAPDLPDRFKIGYSEEQYNWMVRNEKHIWAAILSNKMLYASESRLVRMFLSDGPFTADFTQESPPRMGQWIGWQIVSGYMEGHPEISMEQLLNEKDSQKILTKSGYKPGL